MAKTCSSSVCCKITTCVTKQSLNCTGQFIAGSTDFQIAVLCAVSDYTVAATNGIDYVTDITLNNPDPEPLLVDGCEDHWFYPICCTTDKQKITIEGARQDNGSFSYTFNATLQWDGIISPEIMQALKDMRGKEVIVRFKENGTGNWLILGFDGGLYVNNINFDWGEAKTDPKFTQLIVTGTTSSGPIYINAGTVNGTTQLIEDTTFDCVAVGGNNCP